eukprot:251151-Amphidinium_carterae.1
MSAMSSPAAHGSESSNAQPEREGMEALGEHQAAILEMGRIAGWEVVTICLLPRLLWTLPPQLDRSHQNTGVVKDGALWYTDAPGAQQTVAEHRLTGWAALQVNAQLDVFCTVIVRQPLVDWYTSWVGRRRLDQSGRPSGATSHLVTPPTMDVGL